jgi:hypothetical protein
VFAGRIDASDFSPKITLILVVIWLGVGLSILLPWLANNAMVDAFNQAQPCVDSSPSQRPDCYTTNAAVVEKIDWDPTAHPRGGRQDNTLTLYVEGLGERQTVASGSVALYELNPGDRIQVKVWNGKVTDITTLGQYSASAHTHDNPIDETNYYSFYMGTYAVGTVIGALMWVSLRYEHPPGS